MTTSQSDCQEQPVDRVEPATSIHQISPEQSPCTGTFQPKAGLDSFRSGLCLRPGFCLNNHSFLIFPEYSSHSVRNLAHCGIGFYRA